MKRLLIVEDEQVIRDELARFLRRHGFDVGEASSVPDAIRHDLNRFDVLLVDVRLPGAPGTDLVAHARGRPVLLMTSFPTVRGAVGAMRSGAVDYITKPFDLDELLASLDKIVEPAVPPPAPSTPARPAADFGILGSSAAIVAVRERIRKLAPSEATVLVLGPSGTGKELVARGLHQASPRVSGPFVAVNCAAIPEALIESELFGHQRGAFTGATSNYPGLVQSAENGTLFLDEIGELPASAQARLLRFLQTGEVRSVGSARTHRVKTRLVAATHRDLAQLAKQGAFREDLYFRLRVLELRLPPLAQRGDDVLVLAESFVDHAAKRAGISRPTLSPDTRKALLAHDWPGNVRELENAIERAVVLCEGDSIEPEHLVLEVVSEDAMTESGRASPVAPGSSRDLGDTDVSLETYFRRFVLENQGQMTETELARRLGLSRKALWERRQRFNLPRRRD
jgi:DNA-binding NtrC family response regulator